MQTRSSSRVNITLHKEEIIAVNALMSFRTPKTPTSTSPIANTQRMVTRSMSKRMQNVDITPVLLNFDLEEDDNDSFSDSSCKTSLTSNSSQSDATDSTRMQTRSHSASKKTSRR